MLPPAKPRLSLADLESKIAPYAVNRALHPMIVVGLRGYYRDTMGAPGRNDRGIYDDAICLVTPNVFATFNGNTDPTSVDPRLGLASLEPGAYYAHRFDLHGGKYLALCQRLGPVIVHRDLTDSYAAGIDHDDYGHSLGKGLWKGSGYGINIHKGGYGTTSSLGCQTIYPNQWDGFISLATAEAKRLFKDAWRRTIIPYLLVDVAA